MRVPGAATPFSSVAAGRAATWTRSWLVSSHAFAGLIGRWRSVYCPSGERMMTPVS